MSVITVQIRRPTVTRNREDDELSDPLTEFEDGDGESVEVEHSFDIRLRVLHLPTQLMFKEHDYHFKDKNTPQIESGGITISAGLGDRQGQNQPNHGQQSESEKLRDQLVKAQDKGLQVGLKILAAAAETGEPIELRSAVQVPGGWLRGRLTVNKDRLQLSAGVRPAPDANRGNSTTVSVRTPGFLSRLDMKLSGLLTRNGGVRDLKINLDDSQLPPIPSTVKKALKTLLDPREPKAAVETLKQLAQDNPTSTAHVIAEQLKALESVRLGTQTNHPPSLAPTFEDLVKRNKQRSQSAPTLNLKWTKNEEPILTRGDEDIEPATVGLRRDLDRLKHLAAVILNPSE